MDLDTEFWMTNLPESVKSRPIIELAIPGSHDSGTYDMAEDSDLSPDAEEVLKKLEFLGPLLTRTMYKWSKTQETPVTQQLNYGVRYFDLRTSTKTDDPNLFFVHGLYATEVRKFLTEVNDFLDSHGQEIVILDFNHFYAFESHAHEQLLNLLMEIFEGKLLPISDLRGITLDFMTNRNTYQVMVVYRAWINTDRAFLWSSGDFPTPWADTVDIKTLISFLDDGVQNRDSSVGFISQCILTPSVRFLVEHVLSSLKEECFLHLETAKYEWLKDQKPGPGGVNIIISNFVDYNSGHFPRTVIALNAKLK